MAFGKWIIAYLQTIQVALYKHNTQSHWNNVTLSF